jgi:hypothetical protein
VKIVLRNSFHNTEVGVRAHVLLGEAVLMPAQVKRVRRALCGVDGCTCSGVLGVRGPQDTVAGVYESHEDGAVTLHMREG